MKEHLWARQCFVLYCYLLFWVKNTVGFSPFLFIILLIFSDDLEKKLLCGFKLLSISRFLATFPVCSSCCKSSSMLMSKILVSLLKHTLAWESLHSFLYIFLQNITKRTKTVKYFTSSYELIVKRFLGSFVKKTAFILTSPIKFNGPVAGQSHARDNSAVRLTGSIISKMADGANVLWLSLWLDCGCVLEIEVHKRKKSVRFERQTFR